MNSLCILYVLAIISASFAADIPNSFDAREAWPQCADIIGQVRDQSQCGGAGWAFGSVEAMSDRICIHSNATIKVHVSADDLITCCPDCANGCKRGGSATTAWNYWVSEGITTGGLYNATREGCKSYWLPPCTKPNVKDCSVTILPPTCSASCDDSSLDYEEQKTYGKGVSTFKGEEEIKKEIITNGPVTATINQFIDLYDYAKEPKPTKIIKLSKSSLKTKNGKERNRLKLVCRAAGLPFPRISWRRENVTISNSTHVRISHVKKRSTLVIRHPGEDDFGRYECVARGIDGDPAIRSIEVRRPPRANLTSTTPFSEPDSRIPCQEPFDKDFCLNDGICYIDLYPFEPYCECPDGFSGNKCAEKTLHQPPSMYPQTSLYTCKLGLSTKYYC